MDFELEKHRFAENFKDCEGFYARTAYIGDDFGFTLKKKLRNDDKNSSLISFYISKEELESRVDKKAIQISVSYGKEHLDGISIRDGKKIKFFDPVDLISDNDYYYDLNRGKFFVHKIITGDQNISACEILRIIYGDHIKSTKILRGFWIRFKMFFWHVIIRHLSELLSTVLHSCLYLVSGDRYTYDPILGEGKLNDRITSSRWKDRISPEPKGKLTSGDKIDVFGYKAKSHSVFVYSSLHLVLYYIFETRNYKPEIITTMFQNNFLTLMYVICSLWIIEAAIPKILIYLIKYSSKLSIECLYRKIRI